MDLTKEQLQVLISDSVKSAMDSRVELSSSKLTASEISLAKSLSKEAQHVEIPTISAKKGGGYNNLPVHEKMLANIALQRSVYHGLEGYKEKALDTTTSGSGLEYIPSILSSKLLEDLSLMPFISNLFETIMVNQLTTQVPNVKGHSHFSLSSVDGVAKAGGHPTTGQTTLTSKIFTGYNDYTVDLDEFSVIDVLPMLQKNILESWGRDLDDCIINGDSTSTHQDTDTQAEGADYYLRAWKGLRKLAIAGGLTTAGGGSVISSTLLVNTAKAMGKYSTYLSGLFYLVSGYAQWELFKNADFKDQTILLAKYGTESEVARGLSGFIKTIPIYNSEFVRSDVASTGVNAASGNTLTTALCVHRDMFKLSLIKKLKIWVVTGATDSTLATARKNRIYAEVQAGFNPVFVPSATHQTVNCLINTDD
jgi:hypothetical protein